MDSSKQRHQNAILATYIDENNRDEGVRAWMELGDKYYGSRSWLGALVSRRAVDASLLILLTCVFPVSEEVLIPY